MGCFTYKAIDHIPDWEDGAWNETFGVWHKQGLPAWVKSNDEFDGFFGLETVSPESPPMFINTWPIVPREIVSETATTRIVRQGHGGLAEESKDGASIPHYIDFPIKNMDDWKVYREKHFNLNYEGRWLTTDKEWKEMAACLRKSEQPVGINCGGCYSFVRDLMGVENGSVAFAMDPELVETMLEDRCNMVLKAMDIAFKYCKVDFSYWWEDMCFNHGPLISPAMFTEFLVPRYKRIVAKLEQNGVKIHMLDSDGDVTLLVPLWLGAGINCMFPLEVRAGTDAVALRKQYGKKLIMRGGVDKMQFETKAMIDRELGRLAPLVADGGYIPHLDHRVPPTISYENYRYYLKRKREMFGIPQPA